MPTNGSTTDGATTGETAGVARPRRTRTKSLPQHNRANNRSLILQTLFSQGAMSRADLSRQSGLTRPTVSGLVAELEADTLVSEIGLREDARIGKPATLVNVNVDAFHIVVVDLSGTDRFVGAVVNLRGDVLERATIDIDGATGDAAVGRVTRLIERLAAMTPRRLLGIGIGCPGVIDDNGTILEALLLGWSDFDLKGHLADHFRVPVHVVNDANLGALGVHSFGNKSTDSVIVITIENGVGAGLILEGNLVLGEQFSAGEIGHVTVDDDGEPCPCGRNGCLEVMIGATHLRERLASTAESEHAKVLADAGRALGTVLAPIVSAVNLTDVVLSGPADLLDGAFSEAVLATTKKRTLARIGRGLTLTTLTADANLVLLGGASLVLAAELGVS